MNNKESETSKAKKGGRPRKARTGLPSIKMMEAIEWVKKLYDKFGNTLVSFSDVAETIGLKEAYAKIALGKIRSEYGLLDQKDLGWEITDLGRRAAQGERDAIIQVMKKNKILGNLFDEFKDKTVSRGYLEDFIKKRRYKGFIDTSGIADRFLEYMDYINKIKKGGIPSKIPGEQKVEWFKILIQLKYALNPPEQREISSLANEVAEELKNNEDVSIRKLSNQIKQNLENNDILTALVDTIVDILSEKYPILKSEIKE